VYVHTHKPYGGYKTARVHFWPSNTSVCMHIHLKPVFFFRTNVASLLVHEFGGRHTPPAEREQAEGLGKSSTSSHFFDRYWVTLSHVQSRSNSLGLDDRSMHDDVPFRFLNFLGGSCTTENNRKYRNRMDGKYANTAKKKTKFIHSSVQQYSKRIILTVHYHTQQLGVSSHRCEL
jgi:hypothetical protein